MDHGRQYQCQKCTLVNNESAIRCFSCKADLPVRQVRGELGADGGPAVAAARIGGAADGATQTQTRARIEYKDRNVKEFLKASNAISFGRALRMKVLLSAACVLSALQLRLLY